MSSPEIWMQCEECLSANYKDIRSVSFISGKLLLCSEWSKARKRLKDTNRLRRKGLQLKIKFNHVDKKCILQHLKTEVYSDVWLVNWIVLLQHSLIEKKKLRSPAFFQISKMYLHIHPIHCSVGKTTTFIPFNTKYDCRGRLLINKDLF